MKKGSLFTATYQFFYVLDKYKFLYLLYGLIYNFKVFNIMSRILLMLFTIFSFNSFSQTCSVSLTLQYSSWGHNFVDFTAYFDSTKIKDIYLETGNGDTLRNFRYRCGTGKACINYNYLSTGDFDAIVTITDSLNQVCKDTIAVKIECVANFSYSYDSTNTVKYTNLSEPIDSLSFLWKANFNSSDSSKHYTYNYGKAGHVYPELVATLPNGKKCMKDDSISINVCDLEYHMKRDSLWLEIETFNTSFDSVQWNFGNAYQSSYFMESDIYPNSVRTLTLSQAYSYQIDSIYEVSVRTIDEFGNTCRDTLMVNFQACHAGFSKFLDSTNNKVILSNYSSGTPGTTFFYRFGDGFTANSSSKNISHSYSAYGTYYVCVTVQNFSNGQRCNETFCDSVGLDSLGNLKSNGFTVEFIDTLIVTSVEELELQSDKKLEGLKVYPNPSKNVFNVELSNVDTQLNRVEVELYSAYGSLILKYQLNSPVEKIDLSNYADGIYLLRLTLENKVSVRKLIKN